MRAIYADWQYFNEESVAASKQSKLQKTAVRLGHFAIYIYERGDCVGIYHLVEVVSIL